MEYRGKCRGFRGLFIVLFLPYFLALRLKQPNPVVLNKIVQIWFLDNRLDNCL